MERRRSEEAAGRWWVISLLNLKSKTLVQLLPNTLMEFEKFSDFDSKQLGRGLEEDHDSHLSPPSLPLPDS